jgi:hypothetical protein
MGTNWHHLQIVADVSIYCNELLKKSRPPNCRLTVNKCTSVITYGICSNAAVIQHNASAASAEARTIYSHKSTHENARYRSQSSTAAAKQHHSRIRYSQRAAMFRD